MALKADLGNYRQQAAKAALASNPSIAMDVLHYSVCLQVLETGYQNGRNLIDMNFSVARSDTSKSNIEEMQATKVFETAKEKLDIEWLNIDDRAQRFDAFCNLTKGAKEKLITYCVSASLRIGVRGESEPDYMVDKLSVPFAQYWRPTMDNYLSRVSGQLLIENFASARGEQWATDAAASTMKKSDLVINVDEWLKTDSGKNWIPEQF